MNKFAPLGKVKNVNATILAPEQAGLRIILNLVGMDGKFDEKIDKLLTARWARVRLDVKEWYATRHNFKLGALNTNSAVASDVWIVSALVRDDKNVVNAVAVEAAMKKLSELCKYEKASLHVSEYTVEQYPAVKDLLNKYIVQEGINLYYYTEQQK